MTPTSTTSSRIDWMDALRGIAITMVVLEHAIRFTRRIGFEVPVWVDIISDALSPVRMPAMAFLSGLLLQHALAKGAAVYLGGKTRNILWPFLVWSVIYTVMLVAVGGTSGLQHGWDLFLEIATKPPGHMWFLRDLFLFFVLMLVLRRAPRLPVVAVALGLSGFFMAISTVDNNNQHIPRFLFLFAFFVLGDWAARRREQWPSVLDRPVPVALAVAVMTASLPAAVAFGNMRYELVSLPFVLAGIVCLMLLARVACRTPLSGTLRFFGRDSLVVYVVHWLLLAIVVTLFDKLAPETPGGVVLATSLAVAMALSALAIAVHRPLGLRWMFAFPVSQRRLQAPKALAAGNPR
ncbi:acyltransferase family protein [Arenibaculum pallidiluteum]|uniref:acyltransferase family protein n=1 Tax=Arenibaculum pallidiluteum TaxID=2812559 RepID=UPI001A975731|nr:acyltransferase [Arenibaculum pallidiluteum]